MTAESRVARAFGLDEVGWARHANPWSGWTRFTTCLPLLVLAIWSRVWLGWWSLAPILLALLWIWLNPRAFGPVRDDRDWIAKGVFGERLWSNRHRVAVPNRHKVMPNVLNIASLMGFPFVVWGLVTLDLWPTVFGIAVITIGKLWYIDRMAILYEDMISSHPELRYRPPQSYAVSTGR
ncbi:hypothetical protein GO308_16040 [Sphingomonas sp. SFZ2018-12]|uniref:DUF6653 family protein n=1 Tax=Sphingomonas sp. SFZ2018-12 TaxID=2683197 RepID=UPI001F10BFD0|nr:DUF6653 family protein [Sphingomonas sp. SFZ2018-12]MCH4894618.1 hypothetical protein [Sphingomonas sp. SFZ2018-12]